MTLRHRLSLSRRRPLWYRNQSIDLQSITYLFVTGVSAASPRNPVCPEYNRIAWRQQKPYFGLRVEENIENAVNDGANMTGIVLTIFNKAMNSCCQGNIQNKWLLQFSSQDKAVDILVNDSIDFIMPIQRDLKSQKFLHNPFVKVGKLQLIFWVKLSQTKVL